MPSRSELRKLRPGERVYDRGVVYERLEGDGRWSVDVVVAKQRHRFVVGCESEGFTLTQARDVIASLKARKRERRHGVPAGNARTITFKDAAALYEAHMRDTGGKDRDKKAQRLALHLVPKLGALPFAGITFADLKRYRTKREAEGAKVSTVNRELAVVSHLFRLAADAEELNLVSAPPCRIPRVKEPELNPVYLTPDQAQGLLAAAAEDPNPHVEAFVMIGLHTGMRRSAILRIRVADVDVRRRVLWVDKDKAGERQQPLTGELCAFLSAYMRDRLPEGAEYLFPAPRAEAGHAVNVYKAFVRCLAAAKLPHAVNDATGRRAIVIHTLRHTMATNASHAGVDGATLQQMGGWKTRRMVERYTHAGAMRDAMDKLEAAYRPQKSRKSPRAKSGT